MWLRDFCTNLLRKILYFLTETFRIAHFESCDSLDRENIAQPSKFDLGHWIIEQKSIYGHRDGLNAKLEYEAKHYNEELLGISGDIIDNLIYEFPRMIPVKFWGGDLGWRSEKRKKRCDGLLSWNGITLSNIRPSILIRFKINALEWILHPYVPPTWVLSDYDLFSRYIIDSRDAFELCLRWRAENSIELVNRLRVRLKEFPIEFGVDYCCYENIDYAELAFQFHENVKDFIHVKTVWKGEAQLAELVTSIFPDAQREYSPPWLPNQRIDIFIPLIQVALEYHGEQHYRAVDYFGGESGLRITKERDKRKAESCKKVGVTYIEWKYSDSISESELERKLMDAGISIPC